MCADSSEILKCPIWTYPSHSGKCVCGDDLDHVILCNPETLTVRFTVKSFYFMLFNSNHSVNMTLLGTCPYGNSLRLPTNFIVCHMRTAGCAHFTIERDSFVENVQKTILSQPIHTTLDVSNAKITTTDGLSS